jgi:hypothetical protein
MNPVGFDVTLEYLADLCRACGWSLTLTRDVDEDPFALDGRFALRVLERRRGPLLAGIKFTGVASFDVAAECVFDALHEKGLV